MDFILAYVLFMCLCTSYLYMTILPFMFTSRDIFQFCWFMLSSCYIDYFVAWLVQYVEWTDNVKYINFVFKVKVAKILICAPLWSPWMHKLWFFYVYSIAYYKYILDIHWPFLPSRKIPTLAWLSQLQAKHSSCFHTILFGMCSVSLEYLVLQQVLETWKIKSIPFMHNQWTWLLRHSQWPAFFLYCSVTCILEDIWHILHILSCARYNGVNKHATEVTG